MKEDLEKLVDKNKYQVFILMSRPSFPFYFAVHPWIVINKKGEIKRFEIRHHLNKDKNYGYLHINAQPPFQGFQRFYPFNKFFSQTKLIKMIEGDENSVARKVIDFVENSKENYLHTKKYSFAGPNCGTYIEWILNNFPEINVELPWNAIGKNYLEIK